MGTIRRTMAIRVGTFVLAGTLTGALTGVLSGCAGEQQSHAGVAPTASATAGPTAARTPGPTASTTPTAPETNAAAPTDAPGVAPVEEVADVVVSADAIGITSSDGARVSVSYFGPTEGTVDALSAVFGAAPVVGVWAGGIESFPGVTYTWPGVQLIDDGAATVEPTHPEYWIVLTAAECNGVTLTAVDGVQVGDSAADLEAAHPETATRISVGGGPERLDVMLGVVPLANDESRTFSVLATADDPSGSVSRINAPVPNFGV